MRSYFILITNHDFLLDGHILTILDSIWLVFNVHIHQVDVDETENEPEPVRKVVRAQRVSKFAPITIPNLPSQDEDAIMEVAEPEEEEITALRKQFGYCRYKLYIIMCCL